MFNDSDIKRFLNKVQKTSGCWNWKAYKLPKGLPYGVFGSYNSSGKWSTILAHRASFRMFKGSIDGVDILHTCDNPSCVNPEHLYAGDHFDNMADAVKRRRLWQFKITHCPQGHEYTLENTYIYKTGRHCRTCRKIKGLERYHRNK